MLIDATHAEETRVVVVDGNKVEEFDFESENKRQLAGNIYLAKVTRVEPSLQAAFVDYGGNRHGFLAFSEIHPDYYQIPVADREALMEEERAYAEAVRAREEDSENGKSNRSKKSSSKAAASKNDDPVETKEVKSEINGMETIDLDDDDNADVPEGTSPMELVAETPVEEPLDDAPVEGTADAKPDASDDAAEDNSDDGATPETATTEDTQDDAVEQEVNAADGDTDKGEEDESEKSEAVDKDSSIESVAVEDDAEDIRPPRKPRPRRYKIQEVIKVRQVLLVQVVKEERGNKGAALTTYLSLAGRYCVLMPNTARGGGISRKITNASDRKKLKEIAAEIDVPTGAGLIVRTAGAKRTKAEIKRDYEYLQRLWEQIRELTLKSIAPAKIYEEGDLIKRSIRDLYNRDIDEVYVEGERGYRIAKDFMKMIMPSHAKNVKQYSDSLPLFARYQVESYLSSMFNPTVQLKSGGYIVIGVTEALVAIDVNSGRATKEGSIEDTALKTNLEAAEEVARQLRLRDLAGLIVIDFIDMEERKNNSAVEKRLKDKLKTDRARIQVGRISGFGLLEMSRQRLRPGMIEATTQPCPACHGTGLIRSDDNLALSILRQVEEEGVRRRSREVLVKCPVGIANYLMNQKREHIAQIESRYGLSVRIEGDPHLVSPDYALEKFKTATRIIAAPSEPVVSVDTTLMDQIDADFEDSETVSTEGETGASESEAKPKKKRRRRRRRSSSSKSTTAQTETSSGTDSEVIESSETETGSDGDTEAAATDAPEQPDQTDAPDTAASEADETAPTAKASDSEAPEKTTTSKSKTKRSSSSSRSSSKKTTTKSTSSSKSSSKTKTTASTSGGEAQEADTETPSTADSENDSAPVETKPKTTTRKTRTTSSSRAKKTAEETEKAVETTNGSVPEPAAASATPDPVTSAAPASDVAANEPPKPKKRGWWSLGSK